MPMDTNFDERFINLWLGTLELQVTLCLIKCSG